MGEVEPSQRRHLQRLPHSTQPDWQIRGEGLNGFFHSFYFTTGLYPDNIEITKIDHRVTEAQCRRCHENITAAIDGNVVHGKADGLQCTRCHTSVGHSESDAALKFPIVARSTYAQH